MTRTGQRRCFMMMLETELRGQVCVYVRINRKLSRFHINKRLSLTLGLHVAALVHEYNVTGNGTILVGKEYTHFSSQKLISILEYCSSIQENIWQTLEAIDLLSSCTGKLGYIVSCTTARCTEAVDTYLLYNTFLHVSIDYSGIPMLAG